LKAPSLLVFALLPRLSNELDVVQQQAEVDEEEEAFVAVLWPNVYFIEKVNLICRKCLTIISKFLKI
jgi:hypothetical protein